MDLNLRGKVALVTGGSKGIGLACARVLGMEGARVVIAARGEESLRTAAHDLSSVGIEVYTLAIDFRDGAEVRLAMKRIEHEFGPIEILVNAVGAAKHYPPDHDDHSRWRTGIEDKYLPLVHALDAVVPVMGGRGSGVVVNIAGAGGKQSNPMHMPGGAANAAIMLVTSAMAKAWGPKGVRLNIVNPGSIETERLTSALEVKARTLGRSLDEVRDQAIANIPLRRYGRTEEIAWLCAFLASERASYISGAIVAIDGGSTSLV